MNIEIPNEKFRERGQLNYRAIFVTMQTVDARLKTAVSNHCSESKLAADGYAYLRKRYGQVNA